jgi:hypothetical protein
MLYIYIDHGHRYIQVIILVYTCLGTYYEQEASVTVIRDISLCNTVAWRSQYPVFSFTNERLYKF